MRETKIDMKYKNYGKKLTWNATKEGTRDPENLLRYGDKTKRTSKSFLTRGAFGAQLGEPNAL